MNTDTKPPPVTCTRCGKPYSSFAHQCDEQPAEPPWRPLEPGEEAQPGDKIGVLLGGMREPRDYDWPHTEGAHRSYWRTRRPLPSAPPDSGQAPTEPEPAPAQTAREWLMPRLMQHSVRNFLITAEDANVIADRADRAEAEAKKWKANHDNQVKIKRAVVDRPDLGDRAASVQSLIAERDKLAKGLVDAIAIINEREAERDRLREALEDIASGSATLPGYSISDAAQVARAALNQTK